MNIVRTISLLRWVIIISFDAPVTNSRDYYWKQMKETSYDPYNETSKPILSIG
jgi:hypothetical protein